MRRLNDKFADQNDVRIITVHSPEFEHERDRNKLKLKMEKYGVKIPTYIDRSRIYFGRLKAYGWPSLYLVDKEGEIRYSFLGETHSFFAQARAIEHYIEELLKD